MRSTGFRRACLAAVVCLVLVSAESAPRAASFAEFVDPDPSPGDQFGQSVLALSNGNVVITSLNDDANGTNTGAVYLFNGATGALISTLRGSSANDHVGTALALPNGNFVVVSPNWDNGAVADAGAVTWCNGVTGLDGVVSPANSLIGATASDLIGSSGITVLTNGNYVVMSPVWHNGGQSGAGAATLCDGVVGTTGVVSAANSLVGFSTSDAVGSSVVALTNGNYVVVSPLWDLGFTVDAGAVTWGNGFVGVRGTASQANSLVGSKASDNVGSLGVTALTNGSYVVRSPLWDNGSVTDAGAATWGNGTTGVSGMVSAANSLVGASASDRVSTGAVIALPNGNYVVDSQIWGGGPGAVTFGSGASGVIGVVSSANSLVGSNAADNVGSGGVIVLTNGNYVVRSPNWANGASIIAGAVTWGSGTSGVSGTVSAANSLVGTTLNDNISFGGVVALTNGNYVVASPGWDNGATVDVGAVTFANGATGIVGAVSAANSLIGTTSGDQVGTAVTALTNGNYVVRSPSWDNAAIADAGAATWCNGTFGRIGNVSSANSLVGASASDRVSITGVTALTNGNYVVQSQLWDNGGIADAGAATWGNGTSGTVGVVSPANSLVGSTATDQLASSGAAALANGNYLVRCQFCDVGAVLNAGAMTWGNGLGGTIGTVSASNSLVGASTNDNVGQSGPQQLPNGAIAITATSWDNGALANAGAFTVGVNTVPLTGVISSSNSVVGQIASSGFNGVVLDSVNGNFIGRFPTEGRVRVGSPNFAASIAGAADIPADQGGWLRLTYTRSPLDVAGATPPVTQYGLWRHVPGTAPAGGAARLGVESGARVDRFSIARMRVTLPSALGAREVDGRLFVTGAATRSPGLATSFPPGTWELVANVPAVQMPQYVAAVPTVSNAAANDFVVTAHTAAPATWFISNTISGQSVDNLAPAPPTGLLGAYSSGATHLQWDANSEPDLGSYSLYRGASVDFVPAPANRIASQGATSYSDVGAAGGYYKLSAIDVNGNESGFALLTPDATTDAPGSVGAVRFALDGVRPNPARRHDLEVAFALPSGAPARLELLDVEGRRVREREVGVLGAGRHTVNLADGRGVATGIYWVRLTQGPNHRATRAAVLE